jgi:hypothetical protein
MRPSLDIDLSYQGFDAEMEAMPGKYAPPAGELLLARYPNGTPVGCVGTPAHRASRLLRDEPKSGSWGLR